MFRSVWKEAVSNPMIKIPLIIVILLPAIFAGIFLGSMWDPYGHAENLKVAVINNDCPVTFKEEKLTIGDNLVENLKDNDAMDFEETTRAKAEQGLKDGTYSMIITVPENFSANAATLLEEHPKKMKLKYETNPGINFLGSMVSRTAAENIVTNVSDQVTEQYAGALLDAMGNMQTGLENAAEGSDKLVEGTDKLQTGYRTLSSKIKTLQSGVLNFESGTKNLKVGLNNYIAGTQKVAEGAKRLESGVTNMNSGVSNMQNGLQGLTSASESLQTGVLNYMDKVDDIYATSQKMDEQTATLLGEIKNTSTSSETESNSVSAAMKALDKLYNDKVLTKEQYDSVNNSLTNAENQGEQTKTSVAKISQGLNVLQSETGTLDTNLSGLAGQRKSLTVNLNGVMARTQALNQRSAGLISGAANLEKGVNGVLNGTTSLEKNSSKLTAGVNKLEGGSNAMKTGTGKLAAGTASMGNGISALAEGAEKLDSNLYNGLEEANDNLQYTGKNTEKMIAEPVSGESSEMTSVDNMGNSMAAFLATVGIWVGAMVFCLMYPIAGRPRDEKRGISAWGRNAVVFLPMSVIWGLAIIPLMRIGLAIHPDSWGLTLLVAALTALAFVSITYFVNIAAGKPAMGIVLVLLCLQLSCSGGIFPIDMTSKFYQVLHPFMPFTYSVEAFRSTMANGNSILIPCLVLLGIAVLFNLLSILVHQKQYKKERRQKEIDERMQEIDEDFRRDMEALELL